MFVVHRKGGAEKPPKREKHTITARISRMFAVILSLVLLLLVLNSVHLYRVTTDTFAAQQQNLMTVSEEQLYANLRLVSAALEELVYENVGEISLYSEADELRRYLAAIDTAQMLSTEISVNSALECVYFTVAHDSTLLTRFSDRVQWRQRFSLEEYIRLHPNLHNDIATDTWHLTEIDGLWYLTQNFRVGSAMVGSFVEIDGLVELFEGNTSLGDAQYFITDIQGALLSENAPVGQEGLQVFADGARIDGRHMVITRSLSSLSLRAVCLIPLQNIYQALDANPLLILAFLLVMVVLLLWSNRYLKRQIAAPLLQLVEGTRQIAGGNIHHRVPMDDATASAEFLSLIRAFNDMTIEIETLKIATYEEQLERQALELNALRLRLRPHFYLNAISTISSLSIRGNNHDIQKFVAALSEYLRYLFSDESVAATVQTEFAHAAAFVRLQQVRSPGMIFYYYEIDESIRDVPVPKLMVQTFVENIFKHAFGGEKMISVFFKAMPQRRGDTDCVYLMVEDTGCGFPPAILQGGFSEGSVGIPNIAKTLRMQYGREDLLRLSNSGQGGALVEIWLPLNSGKGDSHDAFDC